MKRVNVHGFYLFGQVVQPLSAIKEKASYGDCFYSLFTAREHLMGLLSSGVVPLHTCRAAMNKLVLAINGVVPGDIDEAIQKEQKTELSWFDVYQIQEGLREFQTVFAAELPLVNTYSVSQKGAYSITDLVDHAEITFSDSIRALLPVDATRDIQQAGRCIAFDVPTAAAFHILRAIEAVMLKYLDVISDRKAQPKKRDWFSYIESLESFSADQTVIEELNQIRGKYRNPIMHPEAVVDLDGALAFFGKAQFVIYTMLEGCKNHKSNAVLPLGQGVEKTAASVPPSP